MTKEFGSMRLADVEDASLMAAQGVIDAARRQGLEDVAVATIGSPVGDLLVAGTRRGREASRTRRRRRATCGRRW